MVSPENKEKGYHGHGVDCTLLVAFMHYFISSLELSIRKVLYLHFCNSLGAYVAYRRTSY